MELPGARKLLVVLVVSIFGSLNQASAQDTKLKTKDCGTERGSAGWCA